MIVCPEQERRSTQRSNTTHTIYDAIERLNEVTGDGAMDDHRKTAVLQQAAANGSYYGT